MFITEIFCNGESLDMYADKGLKYSIQVNDIAELKDRQTSYTKTYDLPKTPKNVRILGGLGIPSDTSISPYTRPKCQIKIDGFDFISKGWLNVTDTDENYNISVYSGIIEFFKAIENKTLGNDLDLSEINHVKDVDTVIDSFTNPAYRYLITDYNGLTHYGTTGEKINIDYLVPSVSVKYLWDKVHALNAFTYSGIVFDSALFNNLWITYPEPLTVDDVTNKLTTTGDWTRPENPPYPYPFSQMSLVGLTGGNKWTVPEKGKYKISFKVDPEFIYVYPYRYPTGENAQYLVENMTTGAVTELLSIPPVNLHQESVRILDLNAGDVLRFYQYFNYPRFPWRTVADLKIDKFDDPGVDFNVELGDFGITDFVKEVLNMFGLTPFPDENSRNIDYKLTSERIITAEVVDWTSKYIERTGEEYTYNSYAQRNVFAYQYNDKEGNYNDGAILINNVNLNESKVAFKSRMYSPEKIKTNFFLGSVGSKPLNVFKLYEKDVKDDGSVEYKGLDKRYHYVRSKNIITDVTVGSASMVEEQAVESLPLADFSDLTWPRILVSFYQQMGRILNDSRIHDLDLNLSPGDILQIDLKKLYYFAQEQQYYILNKVNFDGDPISKVEAIRVKREPDGIIIPPDPVDPESTSIEVLWDDTLDNLPRTGSDLNVDVRIQGMTYPVDDPLLSFVWQLDSGDGTGFVSKLSGASPFTINMSPLIHPGASVAVNNIRLKGVSQSGLTYFSNILIYTFD